MDRGRVRRIVRKAAEQACVDADVSPLASARARKPRPGPRRADPLGADHVRLDVLYDDRFDGSIYAATYDKKAVEIREQQERIRQRIRVAETAALAPIGQAVDLVALATKAADLFLKQTWTEQRNLLRLLLKEASWKSCKLRMSLREPFEKLRLSNRASTNSSNGLEGNPRTSDNWRGHAG